MSSSPRASTPSRKPSTGSLPRTQSELKRAIARDKLKKAAAEPAATPKAVPPKSVSAGAAGVHVHSSSLAAKHIPPLNRLASYEQHEIGKFAVLSHEGKEVKNVSENEIDMTVSDTGRAAPKLYKNMPDMPWLLVFCAIFFYVNFVVVSKLHKIKSSPSSLSSDSLSESIFMEAIRGFDLMPYLCVLGFYFIAILSMRFFATAFLYLSMLALPAVLLKMCFDNFPDSELYWQHAIVVFLSCLLFALMKDKINYWGAMLSLASKGFAANAGLFAMLFVSLAFMGLYVLWTYASLQSLYHTGREIKGTSDAGVTLTLSFFIFANLFIIVCTVLGLQQMITARAVATWYFGYSEKRQGTWNCTKTILVNGIGTSFYGTTIGGIVTTVKTLMAGPSQLTDGDEVEWNEGHPKLEKWVHAKIVQRNFSENNSIVYDLIKFDGSGWVRKSAVPDSLVRRVSFNEPSLWKRIVKWITKPRDAGALITAALTCEPFNKASHRYNVRFRGSFIGRDGRYLPGQTNQSIKFAKRVYDKTYVFLTITGFVIIFSLFIATLPNLWEPAVCVNGAVSGSDSYCWWANVKIWLWMGGAKTSPITNFCKYLFANYENIKSINSGRRWSSEWSRVVSIFLSSTFVLAIVGALHTAGMTISLAYLEQRDLDNHFNRETTYYKPRVHSLVETEIEKIMEDCPPPASYWEVSSEATKKGN